MYNGYPPLHPELLLSHYSPYCYAKLNLVPFVAIAIRLSYCPVAAKDQQEPHDPWFFISVTLPSALQSKELGERPNPELNNGGRLVPFSYSSGWKLKKSKLYHILPSLWVMFQSKKSVTSKSYPLLLRSNRSA